MAGFFCFLFVAAIIGILVWQFIETKGAVSTMSVKSPYDAQRTAELVDTAFTGASAAVLWTNTSGPGSINKRRRGIRGGITMSIDISPLATGGSQVDMWASETVIYLGVLVNFAGVVNRRKRSIARLVSA